MKKENLIFYYAALQGLYWMSYACTFSFTAVYLLDHGFSDGSIGALIAISGILSVALQPYIAGAADKGTRFSLRSLLMLLCVAELIPCIMLGVFPLPVYAVGALYCLSILLLLSMQPLLSALGMQMIQSGIPLNFGVARSIGSLSYAVLAFFLGTLTVLFSTRCLPFISFTLALLMLLIVMRFTHLDEQQAADKVPQAGTIAVLRSNPRFTFFVIGISAVFISHSTTNNYMIQILGRIGEGNEALGHILSISTLLEMPAMLLCTRILRKWDCGKVLRITSVFFLLKIVGVSMAPNLPLLYVALILQAFSFAPFSAAVVYYVNSVLSAGDQVKGQALVTMGMTAGNIIGSLAGGFIIQHLSVSIMLWLSAAVCAAGVLFFYIGVVNARVLTVQPNR